ncbi:MAG: Unknown protein [uncultured Aureispira sp.]|uniref:Uncharacterized protein n=1 Tax=uncultured Aureispira sp. TaxID=1331704 RepID=A0A6S6SQN4_9BACT|nr:MAG: Unknown protein [uncultured Aureispira sp.]
MVYFLNYLKKTVFKSSFWGILLMLLFPLLLRANYLEEYVAASKGTSAQVFYENLSFDSLLNVPATDQVGYYASIETVLEAHDRQADTFFLVFSEHYLKQNPVDVKDIASLERAVSLGKFLIGKETKYYAIAADYVFTTVTDAMTIGFKEETLDKSNDAILSIVAELKKQQYLVSIPTSNLDKGIHHLKKGNLKYIWSRLWFDYPVLCIVGVLSFCFVIYLMFKKVKKS